MAQYGTDGGVYIGTDAGVFYRNNSHADWQPYSTNLPISAETNRLKPFYRDGKIRNGCWGFGVWGVTSFEALFRSTTYDCCSRTSLSTGYRFFDDYSVVNHTGASWTWTFPGASYKFHYCRNPKCFIRHRLFDVTLMVNNGASSSSRTITGMVQVTNGCSLDTIPGKNSLLLW